MNAISDERAEKACVPRRVVDRVALRQDVSSRDPFTSRGSTER